MTADAALALISTPADTPVPQEAVWLANFTSPRTRATYRNAVADFVSFRGITSADQLRAIGQADVIAWREAMTRAGTSPRTVNNRLSALASLFAHLCNQQLARENPVTGVKRHRVNSRQVETLAMTRQQMRALLDAPMIALETIGRRVNRDHAELQALRDRALLHVYAYTGCRVSEPATLRVRDLQQDQGYWVLDFTVKGGKRNRVAIHPECRQALQLYMEAMTAAKGDAYKRDSWLFQSVKGPNTGRPLRRQRLYQIFTEHARAAGLPVNVVPHSARATFITEALEREHPAEAVQKTVAHASITTILAYDKRDHHPRRSASFAIVY